MHRCRHLHLDLLKQVYVGGIRSTFGLILNGGNMKFEEKKYIIGNLTSIFMNLRCCNRTKKKQKKTTTKTCDLYD
jgi:hypothetical protein